jgi:putative MATE family efflux protein
MKSNEIDMTTGSLPKKILMYSVPLMLSNVLQVMFNLCDVAVVGKFVGPLALGAVGSTSIIITLTTGILLGLAGGVNAVVALFVGAKNSANVKRAVHTSIVICMIAGLLLLLSGLFLSRPVLNLIGTKKELIDGAVIYLTIYLLGSPALAMYNYGNAVLSAVGDTKRPLMYLITAGIINVILNLFFVIVCKLGVVGVALASIISQYISAFLILKFLFGCGKDYGLYMRNIGIDSHIAARVLKIGLPAAVQYSLFAVANLYIQSAVNSFDHVVVDRIGHLQIDVVVARPDEFYTACTSFIAQNLGARKRDRIKKAYLVTQMYSFLIGAVLGALLVVFRTQFLGLFTSDPDVLHYGSIRLGIMGCSYFISAFMDNAAAGARGLGRSVIPTIIVIMGSVVFRIIWVCTIFASIHTLMSLYLVYASAWAFTSIIGTAYFIIIFRKTLR